MNFYWKKEWTTPAVVGVVSFAAGVGSGILIHKKKVDRDIEDSILAAQRLSDAMRNVKLPTVHFDPPMAKDLNIVSEPFEEVITTKDLPAGDFRNPVVPDIDGGEDATEDPGAVFVNVFEDDWDPEEEAKDRTEDAPYILHIDEYFNNEKGYAQCCLTWYAGDQILTDENMVPIHNPSAIVGHLNFGHGSRDEDTVYIRNDKLRAEYEVSRLVGSYVAEMYGIEAEAEAEETDLKHSHTIRKFRDRD
jgi:hypothetical protein